MKVKIIYVILIISLFDIGFVNGQNYRKGETQIPHVVCYGSHKTEKSFVPPPAEFLLKSGAEKKSDIIVNYSLFPADAKEAFEYAVEIWETMIESDIPIHVEARWRTMEQGSLGGARANDHYANFENAPRKDYFYPVAVVEKITKTEISGESFPDIVATFNKDIRWYYGTDGDTPELLYDFVTVVLHEIGHGLGFGGFFKTAQQKGFYGNDNVGDAAAFDLMVANRNNEMLTDTSIFENLSTDLYKELTSNDLYSTSQAAKFNNSGQNPRLYAPQIWSEGSSVNHLNHVNYPSGTENSLMTHSIAPGEAIHDPGPITMGILADIGWKLFQLNLDKPKDMEEKKPITFNLSIESDYKVEANSVYAYYSYDSFQNNKDSILLTYDLEKDLFSTTLDPAIETGVIDYYLSARDKKNRIALVPTEAPEEIYSITIGPDSEPPVISHEPIPYFISNGDPIIISTNANDNLGIDTVYAEIWVNDMKQESFELIRDSNAATLYSGVFNFDPNLFNDGDQIKYRITAIDSSIAKNKAVNPNEDFFTFQIEKIFEPADGYYNDFNAISRDFIISDFDIYTETDFENGSLHSPHPYQSPNKNNSNFNFSTLLKYPIVLNENSIMRYDEVVLVEPGEVLSKFGDDNFWDYVIVEGSKDEGDTWLPLADGYDSGEYSTWKTSYNDNIDNNQSSKTPGNPDLYISRQINLTENGNFNPNDTILIRFRLYSDPYANGWGWTIDNLRIQTPVSASTLTLSPGNILIYPNPVNEVLNVIVEAENNVADLTLELFNVYGQKLKAIQEKNVLGEFKTKIDLSSFNSGMYLLNVRENGKQVYSKKIIRN